MDLPVSSISHEVHSSRESLNNNDGSDKTPSDVSTDDMTTAERFATQSQCTLKKNERFSGSAVVAAEENGCDIPKKTEASDTAVVTTHQNELQEKTTIVTSSNENTVSEGLPTDGSADDDTINGASCSLITKDLIVEPSTKDGPYKSPIPNRNTQKFVSQFADLHLTGGCLSTTTLQLADTVPDISNTQKTFTSFRPQLKVKPQPLRKPLVLPPTTPELTRHNTD